MNGVLLDTHVFVWAMADQARLPVVGWQVIRQPGQALYLSVASAWELAIKVGRGKLRLPKDAGSFVREGCAAANIRLLPVELTHLTALQALPMHHRDPFDRVIVATAQVEALDLLSYDEHLDAYAVARVGHR